MRVLLIDDDGDPLSRILSEVQKDYIVDIANSGGEGAFQSQINEYDAIIIDSKLSDLDSCEVCRIMRDADVFSPILFLGADENIKVKSLDSGADYYLPKPIEPEEVKASIRALIRRNKMFKNKNTHKYQNIKINFSTKQVYVDNKPVELRRMEFDLLRYFLHHKDKTISKEELLEHVWKQGIYANSNIVEVTINTLRKKFKEAGIKEIIRTIRGYGYRLNIYI